MAMMREELLSSTDAALVLGVSPTSVKRWADEGLLPCVKTAGRHRRFSRSAVEQFRATHMGAADAATPEVDAWLQLLLDDGPVQAIDGKLLSMRADRGSWIAVADALGPVVTELGSRWARGAITVLDEHLASERLARALARIAAWLPQDPDAPSVLLATADGDDHTLGLSLAELAFLELGWRPLWGGRRLPSTELVSILSSGVRGLKMIALSASALSSNSALLAAQVDALEPVCRAGKLSLILGGNGAWPTNPSYGRVIRSFAALRDL
jgi:excisionase family DNA binding protein